MPNSKLEVNKRVLIASDIFGLSRGFNSLIKELSITQPSFAVSPYNEPHNSFETEKQAYESFQVSGGIDAYIQKIAGIIQTNKNIKYLIGFSAGAAALYRVMSLHPRKNIQLTLFYPGQIRFFLDKAPNCPCHIIFPQQETHFSLTNVINSLKQHPKIQVEQTPYQHGFMNKDSVCFDNNGYTYYGSLLKKLLIKDNPLKQEL